MFKLKSETMFKIKDLKWNSQISQKDLQFQWWITKIIQKT